MTAPIQPALTAKEWAHEKRFGPGGSLTVRPNERHYAAALCLYGQPFRFTAQDKIFLHELADIVNPMRPDAAEWVGSLATRLSALLPPREDGTR